MTVDATLRAEGLSALNAQGGLVLVPASSVKSRAVRWLSQGRVPLSMVTLLVGMEGEGKTNYAVWLAAQLSRGTLDGYLNGTPTSTIYVTAEDSLETTLKPRLIAAGADLDHVHFAGIKADDDDVSGAGVDLTAHLDDLHDLARSVEARLLILDPVVAFLPTEVNAHRDQNVRRVLAPLSVMAGRLDLAALGLMHLNKHDSNEVLRRISGSRGFSAAARSVLHLGADPDNPGGDTRLLIHAKCNVGAKVPTVRARLEGRAVTLDDGTEDNAPEWVPVGETAHTSADMLAPAEEPTALDEARAFLRDTLKDGAVEAKAVRQAAAAAGLSATTLNRAKRAEGIVSEADKDAEAKTVRAWVWRLPSQVTSQESLSHDDNVDYVDYVAPSREKPGGPDGPHGPGDQRYKADHLDPDADTEIARIQAKFRDAA